MNETYFEARKTQSGVVSRRSFVAGAAALTVLHKVAFAAAIKAPFHLAVLTDEISPDFDHACSVAANDFKMDFVEVRSAWGKGPAQLDTKEIDDMRKILAKYKLRVSDIGSPLFKVDFRGAPLSKESPKNASPDAFDKQDEVLERSMALAKSLGTDRVRGFDYWRLEDQAPYREAMNQKLRGASERLAKEGLMFVLENEMACNTATGAEAAKVLAAVKNPNFLLNWDAGNAVAGGEMDTLAAYHNLPKGRIGHVHCKNAVVTDGKSKWSPVDIGVVDWKAMFLALKRDGYAHAVSLETHWHGGGTPEESTRISFGGMKKELVAAGCMQA